MNISSYDCLLIVDFGSQVTQLIARRLRELNVYCEIHPYQNVNEHLLRQLSPKAIILSGGPDSSALACLADRYARSCGSAHHAIIVNHNIRSETTGEAERVRQRMHARAIATQIVTVKDKAPSTGIQEWARHQRFALLTKHARQQRAVLLLAHHQADQAETVLLRLLRGSGTTGLGAMEVVRDGRYVRPLLGVRRREIEEYAQEWALSYREDSSNRDLRFMRNRVRSELLPLLKEYNPNIAETLNRTARLLKDEDQLLSQLAQEAINAVICERSNNKIVLDSTVLLNYHIALKRRIVRLVLQGFVPGR